MFVVVFFAGKFRKYLTKFFVHNVGQHVEAATVGHANYKFAGSQYRTFFYYSIQCRDERLGAFQRKALLTRKTLVDKLLEVDGARQFFQHKNLVFIAESYSVFGALHIYTQPGLHSHLADKHVFHTHAGAVGLLQMIDNFF